MLHTARRFAATPRGWLAIALCLLVAAALAATLLFAVPLSKVLLVTLALACPLSHLMLGHGGHSHPHDRA